MKKLLMIITCIAMFQAQSTDERHSCKPYHKQDWIVGWATNVTNAIKETEKEMKKVNKELKTPQEIQDMINSWSEETEAIKNDMSPEEKLRRLIESEIRYERKVKEKLEETQKTLRNIKAEEGSLLRETLNTLEKDLLSRSRKIREKALQRSPEEVTKRNSIAAEMSSEEVFQRHQLMISK